MSHHAAAPRRPGAPLRLAATLITLSALAAGLAGCATRYPAEKVPRFKLLVMDFDMAPGLRETPKDIRGWWLGADTVYQNPRAGAMFAERVTARLAPLSFINLFSRVDLKYYLARKRQNLKDAYPYLSEDELQNLMNDAPKIDFARELGADKLLTGRIVRNELAENRTFHWWSSRSLIRCEVVDVLSGQVEWEKEYRLKRRFASQFSVQDEIAGRVTEDLKKGYFLRMAK